LYEHFKDKLQFVAIFNNYGSLNASLITILT
jgi:hypothetical protein